ncbi:hypothetical protein J5N97_009919 [Dioscorea zingiberensis]|uniref:BHLH domain-containing protein n=1 Tax=Dioscorea zingiberensis TaxID=325984 RepID=A0A9D5HM41_9LILI|nr:hypothetical protein J5N97_009919 [Dioscorea zingiberensis]
MEDGIIVPSKKRMESEVAVVSAIEGLKLIILLQAKFVGMNMQVRIAQGLVHLGKGLLTLSPYYSFNTLWHPSASVFIPALRTTGNIVTRDDVQTQVRREHISMRFKMLQDLVPGCDKVTGKALMLDEIINYVQSLQNQVEVLLKPTHLAIIMEYTAGGEQ